MEPEQTQDSNAETILSDENEVFEDLDDLKNNEIQTLEIMPFAVPIHNWNDLKDTVSWAETLIGMSSALKNHMVKYNRLIDTVAQLTRDWNSDISQLQVNLTGTHSIAKDANTKVTNAIKDIQGIWSVNSAQQTSINDLIKSNTTRISEIQNIWSVNTIQSTDITNLKNRDTAFLSDLQSIWDVNKSQATSITDLKARDDAFFKDLQSIWSTDKAQSLSIAGIKTDIESIWTTDKAQTLKIDGIKTDIESIWTTDKAQTLKIDGYKTDIESIWETDKSQASSIAGLKTDVSGIWSVNNIQDSNIKKIDDRLKEIEGFDFGSVIDLTVLVTAINSVGTKVQNLIDLFNVTKIEPGTFTFFLQSSIKTQTDAIIQALAMVDESLNNNFINYFDDSINGKFWKAFKEFDDFQMAVFFEVFFENYRLELDKTWVNTLEVWNTTNGYLDSSYNALVIITQWLKQIYEKPSIPAIVNVSPFDYERLEKMLKKLEFGEITNEAGTNIWDFLKELIATLGETLTGILEFLDSLLDKLISLVVPSDTIFITSGFESIKVKFNVKFGALLGLADSLKDLFTPTPRDFKQAVSFDFLGAKFEPDFSMIDPYVKKFRVVMSLSLWMSVVVFIFRKITGTGDLVNDN